MNITEINRVCNASQWRYVVSSNIVADIGTRKGAKFSRILQNSGWINGLIWMGLAEEGGFGWRGNPFFLLII